MTDAQTMPQKLQALFESQKLAVLATHRAGQPYASLVAFYAAPDLKNLYFATPKTTRKFENLISDKRVAMLINSSTNRSQDFHQAVSVTAVGDAEEVEGDERQAVQAQYLEKHPHLEDFVQSPTCALIKVSVASYFMVQNFQNVMELHLDK